MRFLLVTSRSRRMFDGGSSFAIRFIETFGSAGSDASLAPRQSEKGSDSTPSRRELRAAAARSQGLSHADRGNLQGLPVLGDGAARDHDALLAQDLGDL